MQPVSEQVAGYLQSEGLAFRRNPNTVQPEFEFEIVAENCIAGCRLLIDDEEKRLQISLSSGIRCCAGRAAEANYFLSQVSVGKRRTALYVDYRTGEIVLHSIITLVQPTLSHQAFTRFVQEAVSRYDACLPYIARIIYGGMTGSDGYRAYHCHNCGDPKVRKNDEIVKRLNQLFKDYTPPADER